MSLIKLSSKDGKVRLLDEANGVVHVDGKAYEARDLSISDVHVAGALSGFVTGYGSNSSEAVADIVCPVLPVGQQSDTYHTFDKDNKFSEVTDEMTGEDASIPEVTPKKSTDTYSAKPYGTSSFVSQGSVANADPGVNPRLQAIGRCMNVVNLMHEKRVIAALQNATTFAGYTAAVAAARKWNGGGTSDPIKDLYDGIDAALQPITHIVMSERTWHAFIQNPQVKSQFNYNGNASLGSNPAVISSLLGLPTFVIGSMKGKSPTAGTYGPLWGNHVTLLHIPQGATVNGESVPTARTFRWVKGGSSPAFRIRNWIESDRGQDGGERIAVVYNEHVKVVAAPTGYLLTDCYQ
jgi:hypothetical protein